jgi:hypothetical protein
MQHLDCYSIPRLALGLTSFIGFRYMMKAESRSLIMQIVLYTIQAVECVRSGDNLGAVKYFLAAHAERCQEEEFKIPVIDLFRFFRSHGVELSEEEMKGLLWQVAQLAGVEITN